MKFLGALSNRLTLLITLALLAPFAEYLTGQPFYPFVVSLILSVDVVLDLARVLQAQLLMRHYESFVK